MDEYLQKIIEEQHSFSSWWEKNKELYENSNVSKAIAKTIWGAALDSFHEALRLTVEN